MFSKLAKKKSKLRQFCITEQTGGSESTGQGS